PTRRSSDLELDALCAAGTRRDIDRVLLGRGELLKQGAELDLAPCASGLHVGEDTLEIAHAARHRLHLAQSLVNLLEALAHELEGFTEAPLEGGLELSVHRLTHLLEMDVVALLQPVEALLDLQADVLELAREGLGEMLEALREVHELHALRVRRQVKGFAGGLLKLREASPCFAARLGC